jgi:hypothetical protein
MLQGLGRETDHCCEAYTIGNEVYISIISPVTPVGYNT